MCMRCGNRGEVGTLGFDPRTGTSILVPVVCPDCNGASRSIEGLRQVPVYKPMDKPINPNPVISTGEPVSSWYSPAPPVVCYDPDTRVHTLHERSRRRR